jgi:hypothetical protein
MERSHALARAEPWLEGLQAALPMVQVAECPTRAPLVKLVVAGLLIDNAVRPITTTFKVFDTV